MQPQLTPPAWHTAAFTVQRSVLLELVLARASEPDGIRPLAARLGHSVADVLEAMRALDRVGLVEHDERLAWATASARYHEALLPGRC